MSFLDMFYKKQPESVIGLIAHLFSNDGNLPRFAAFSGLLGRRFPMITI
jgi:hypothetical protein